ncbi:MAG: hypothetical protein JNL41_00145 [Phenylobacterium sp.]|uniref:hypothetical protein n=1 Tax=Phenylobacterium sp. TaxID=1871053 RepID=UPI001A549DCA|nr:hypothetical protein [Phenylobacterium sp.]MBL8552655.1 hypothetical protein [Phenylobacterium sp.]
MDEAARLLTLLALAGGALTLVGGAFAYFLDETRRIRRALAAGLGGAAPQPMLIARGRGVGIGFDLSAGAVVVTWDKGGWRLCYRLTELVGVELIVDRAVAARAFRGEPRRALDQLADPQERVRLRFVFDDPTHPDFALDLWLPEDDGLPKRMDAPEALGEANRWMARMDSILRRAGQGVAKAPATAPVVRQAAARAAPPPALFDDDDDDAFEDNPENAIT